MRDICNQCGDEFSQLGLHWYRSSVCSYPEILDDKIDIITGIMMSDGTVNGKNSSRNPCIQVVSSTREYLEYLDTTFGAISASSPSLHMTAEEVAEGLRNTGFSEDAESDDCNDVYRWTTRRHPGISTFEDWYQTGEKVWPEDIELSPLTLKHLFVGDGDHHPNQGSNHIRINISNEAGNEKKINSMLNRIGFDTPYWDYQKRSDGSIICKIEFTKSQSEKMWGYMGEPLPGFEYKWPTNQ